MTSPIAYAKEEDYLLLQINILITRKQQGAALLSVGYHAIRLTSHIPVSDAPYCDFDLTVISTGTKIPE